MNQFLIYFCGILLEVITVWLEKQSKFQWYKWENVFYTSNYKNSYQNVHILISVHG